METAPARICLGSMPKIRKTRLRDSILRNAECYLSLGLSSRIPFLKKSLCGQNAPDAESAPAKSTLGIAGAEDGKFEIDVTRETFLASALFFSRLARFNSRYSALGIQAFPENDIDRFSVCRCDIRFIGDLKITLRKDAPAPDCAGKAAAPLEIRALYCDPMFQVFVNSGQDSARILIHETEHAIHSSLWRLAGMQFYSLEPEDSEYLAILKTIMETGDKDIGNLDEFRMIGNPDVPESAAYPAAVKRLGWILSERYGISRTELERIAISWLSKVIWLNDPSGRFVHGRRCIEKIRSAARTEFFRGYEHLFGVSYTDLQDVVSGIDI